MTTTPEPTEPPTEPRPEDPDGGDIEEVEDRDPNPPSELIQPQFDDQGDGGEAQPQQE
jgi:hypothetical protein